MPIYFFFFFTKISITVPHKYIKQICLLVDFPRLDQWSENSSLPDASIFMDGFLYVSSGPAKTMPDRRGRDGEFKSLLTKKTRKKKHDKSNQCINPFVSNLSCTFVKGLLFLSAGQSVSVFQLPNCQSTQQTVKSE